MTDYAIPDLAFVALVGVSGSGKSTFAGRHFAPTEVISSDHCRALVSDDENDQSATADAFDLLYFLAGKRLSRGLLAVADATNVQSADRRKLVEVARAHDVLPVAIVLDVPLATCVARTAARSDRDFGERVVRRQHDALRRSMKGLAKEGFRRVHVLRDVAEIDAARLVREPLLTDRRTEHGPFDAIGDVHGCLAELQALLAKLGYRLRRDELGRPIDAHHPDGRRAIFLGDLVDRGPNSAGVLRLAMGMVEAGNALAVPGNHENKLTRALRGSKVTVSHGLERTLAELDAEPPEFRQRVLDFCSGLVSHLVLDDGRLVVAHAGLKEAYHNRSSGRVRSFALYGDTTGETDEYGLPVRYPWAREYRGRAMVLYGHTPVPEAEWLNNTLCLDTGCVFGGSLTALRYPEKEIVAVPAEREWYAPARPLGIPGEQGDPADSGATAGRSAGAGTGARAARRERSDDVLDLRDVLGKRGITTGTLGRVTIREENAAGALEVISRFALEPAALPYLPPTMAPCPTSRRDGYLEHPEDAFRFYRELDVDTVVCEEKHMGSRAIALVCKENSPSYDQRGPGVLYTRTGRRFLDADRTVRFLERLRAACDAIGLWGELETDWVLFDAELLPWSFKAEELIRRQYAGVAAAGRSALSATASAYASAAARGLEVGARLDRARRSAANVEAFAQAYRRYCWETDDLEGVRLAPFQVLATEGRTYADREHLWHLAIADRLVDTDPGFLVTTRRLVVELGDESSTADGIGWWDELTASGGEGMVVKPAANLLVRKGSPVQPGLKCRGREYLRLIYGPDYTEPGNLERLRGRNLGRKHRLALREYALGLEGLERLVRGEPLWRVHECVFGVLALESEPVDPRL